MSVDGYRNIEWSAHNATRNYPLAINADGKSSGGEITLDRSTLLGVYIHVPWDRDIYPDRFFVSQLVSLPDSLTITLSYQPSSTAQVVGTATASKNALDLSAVEITPATGWEDIAGSVVFGETYDSRRYVTGSYSFNYQSTVLEVDCVRPAARSLNGFVVTDGAQETPTITGLVNLRAGENIRIRSEVVGDVTNLYIDALDSSEFAADCECAEQVSDPIRTINGVTPDENGNIDLVGSSCIEVEPSRASVILTNPCSNPCCGCEEVEALTDSLIDLRHQVDNAENYASQLRDRLDQYSKLIGISRSVSEDS